MAKDEVALETLISDDDISFEERILRNPGSEELWLEYYEYKTNEAKCNLSGKIFILERAVQYVPDSLKLWQIYLDEIYSEIKEHAFIEDCTDISFLDRLYQRALEVHSDNTNLWLDYLTFLEEKLPHEITRIRRAFNSSLIHVAVENHKALWELYLQFGQRVSGKTGSVIYMRYLMYRNVLHHHIAEDHQEFTVTVEDAILLLVKFNSIDEALRMFRMFSDDVKSSLNSSVSLPRMWLDFIETLIGKFTDDLSLTPVGNCDKVLESLIEDGKKRFADQASAFYLKIFQYYVKRKRVQKVRYYFESAMNEVSTVNDFTIIFDAYAKVEENFLSELSSDVEDNPGDVNLGLEFDYQMDYFEQLLESRPILMSDLMLRQDMNNLDTWFKRINIFKEKDDMSKMLETYASALISINPLKAHSASNNNNFTLPKLWISYADVYAEKGDVKTAELIYSKGIQSVYKNPESLADVYIGWCELYLSAERYSSAIEVLENVILSEKYDFNYDDTTLSVQLRLPKCVKLWSFYLDTLESFVESKDQADSIQKVVKAYEKVLSLKIANPLMVINYANFLEEWSSHERAFSAYETGLKLFKDPEISFQIWNIYLFKAYSKGISIERLRDLFDRCLLGSGASDKVGCSPELCKTIFLFYAQVEEENGWNTRAISVLKLCLKALQQGIDKLSEASMRSKLIDEKYDIYCIIISKLMKFDDKNEVRALFEDSLEDENLTTSQIIKLGLRFIEFEICNSQFVRVRNLFQYLCRTTSSKNPILDDVWENWKRFELENGNESTFKEMLRFKRQLIGDRGDMMNSLATPHGFVKSQSNVNSERKPEDVKDVNPEAIDIEM